MRSQRNSAPRRRGPEPRRFPPWIAIAILILVPLLLYSPVVTFDFVQADDTDLVRDNYTFLRDLGNIPKAFTRSYFETAAQPSALKTYYRPLIVISFMLDAQLGGTAASVYHATTLAIHIVAVALVFVLLRMFGSDTEAAVLLALTFAVHPANVQTVCWIPGRNDSLMAVFGMLSLVALAEHLRRPRTRWLVLHSAGFAAALFTKESALALVALYGLYAGLCAQRLREYLANRLLMASYAAVIGCWLLLRRAALAGGVEILGPRDYTSAVMTNLPELAAYIGKLLLPINLNVLPGFDFRALVLGAISLSLVCWSFIRYLEARTRLFVACWIILFLAPALMLPGLPAYEHRLYFPIVALIVAVSRFSVWSAPARNVWRAGLMAVQLVFAALSFTHAAVFRDPYTYWTSATRGTPYAALAHVNLGRLHEADGRLDRAADQYRQALDSDPATPGANNNLGAVLAQAGHLEESKPFFEREIELHPRNPDGHYNLGLWYKLSGRIDEAVPFWQRVTQIDPAYLPVYHDLADYYASKGDKATAERYLERLRQLEQHTKE